MRALALLLCLASPALADCADPQDQAEMTLCAQAAYEAADGDLNATYKLAMGVMKTWDADLPKAEQQAVEQFRTAQRAWLAYRDASCASEAVFYAGGSMQSLVLTGCLERMTRARTEEIRAYTEQN